MRGLNFACTRSVLKIWWWFLLPLSLFANPSQETVVSGDVHLSRHVRAVDDLGQRMAVGVEQVVRALVHHRHDAGAHEGAG